MSLRWTFSVILCLSVVSTARGQCPADHTPVSIFFINGIHNDTVSAEISRQALDETLWFKLRAVGFPRACVGVHLSYNVHESRYRDLLQAATQAAGDNELWGSKYDLALGMLGHLFLARKTVSDALRAKILNIDYRDFIRHSDEDLQRLTARYRQETNAGRKVVLVPHSQGNFYANLAFEELSLNGGMPAQLVKIVGVATPTSFIAPGSGLYVTVQQDFIRYVPGALAPTLSTPDCGTAWDCHGFKPTYLTFPNTEDSIVTAVTKAIPPVARFSVSDGSVTKRQGESLVTLATGSTRRISIDVQASIDYGGAVTFAEIRVNTASAVTSPSSQVYTIDLPVGNHTISVVVLDESGNRSRSATASVEVALTPPVNVAPTAGFSISAQGKSGMHGQTLNLEVQQGGFATVAFDASPPRSTDPQGNQTIAAYEWKSNGVRIPTSTFLGGTMQFGFNVGVHMISLEVIDDQGARSAPVAAVLVIAGQGRFSLTSELSVSRVAHTATLLDNGTVLVTGGSTIPGAGGQTAEIYNPATGSWRLTVGSMTFARQGHTAVKLLDGRVLIAGGTNPKQPAEIFDPVTEQFSQTGPTNALHTGSPGILLTDGRAALITGSLGYFGAGTSEIFNPLTGLWNSTLPIPVGVSQMASLGLPDGTVVAFGGYDGFTVTAYPNVVRYDPATNTVTSLASMVVSRLDHTVTLLPSGKVLIVAGSDPTSTVASTELYDPSGTGQSQLSTSLTQSRRTHTSTLLNNGDVLVVGGTEGGHGNSFVGTRDTAELRKSTTGSWSLLASRMSVPRVNHTATLLPNGKVLIAGGQVIFIGPFALEFRPQNSAELYTPASLP